MYNIKSLRCVNCKSVILNLPDTEAKKLNGLTFQCECCGQSNALLDQRFSKVFNNDSFMKFFDEQAPSILNRS